MTRLEQVQTAGWDALESRQYKKALTSGKKLIRMRHSSGFEIGAAALIGLDKRAEAIALLQEGVAKAPDVYRLWQLLGSAFSEDGQLDEAMAAYDRAELCPGSYVESIALNRAIVLDKMERYEEALALLDNHMKTAGSLEAHYVSLRLQLLNALKRYKEVVAVAETLDQLAKKVAQAEQAEAEELSGTDEGHPEKGYFVSDDGLQVSSDVNNTVARAWSSVVEAKKALGHSREELLETALHAVKHDIYCKDAQWWVREIRGLRSHAAKPYNLLVQGSIKLAEEEDGGERLFGYFRKYQVVADSPAEAFEFAKEFEEGEVTSERCAVAVDAQRTMPELEPKGVYSIGSMHLWDMSEDAEDYVGIPSIEKLKDESRWFLKRLPVSFLLISVTLIAFLSPRLADSRPAYDVIIYSICYLAAWATMLCAGARGPVCFVYSTHLKVERHVVHGGRFLLSFALLLYTLKSQSTNVYLLPTLIGVFFLLTLGVLSLPFAYRTFQAEHVKYVEKPQLFMSADGYHIRVRTGVFFARD